MTDMVKVQTVEIPRYPLLSGDVTYLQLDDFSDARKPAYGTNVYLRAETSHGYSTNLIASRLE